MVRVMGCRPSEPRGPFEVSFPALQGEASEGSVDLLRIILWQDPKLQTNSFPDTCVFLYYQEFSLFYPTTAPSTPIIIYPLAHYPFLLSIYSSINAPSQPLLPSIFPPTYASTQPSIHLSISTLISLPIQLSPLCQPTLPTYASIYSSTTVCSIHSPPTSPFSFPPSLFHLNIYLPVI